VYFFASLNCFSNSKNLLIFSGVSDIVIVNEFNKKPKNTISCCGMNTDLSGCTKNPKSEKSMCVTSTVFRQSSQVMPCK
jgi:hypothetical protein